LIAIAGDSWGCGEWDLNNFRVLHTGLEQYFREDGHEVINASKGFINNWTALNRLESVLGLVKQIDKIIWFVTCPARGMTSRIESDPYQIALENLRSDFNQASSIAKKFQCEILAIGGLCDVPDEFQSRHKNIKMLIPNVCSLFIENYPTSIFGDIGIVKHIVNPIQARKVASDVGKKHRLFEQNKWFPDNFHLGRDAYYEVYKIVKQHV
jgi:hypothetical protein